MGSELTITWNVLSPSKNDRISKSVGAGVCTCTYSHIPKERDGNFL